MPADFPTAAFERIWARMSRYSQTHGAPHLDFNSAFQALSYRYLAMAEHGDAFNASLIVDGTSPPIARRFYQEQCLFDFFSAGFSAFDAFFYATFALGALVDPQVFRLNTEEDRRESRHLGRCLPHQHSPEAGSNYREDQHQSRSPPWIALVRLQTLFDRCQDQGYPEAQPTIRLP